MSLGGRAATRRDAREAHVRGRGRVRGGPWLQRHSLSSPRLPYPSCMAEDDFLSTLTRASREIIAAAGVDRDADLQTLSIPDALDRGMKWTQALRIIRFLVERGETPRFRGPSDEWVETRWQEFVGELVDQRLLTWEEVAIGVLGELNPPQVGTSLASKKNFQRHYPPRQTMRAVMSWFYGQNGTCSNCGRRLPIEVDHVIGKDEFIKQGRDPAEADHLDNLQLLCKRCNVIKRESHALGGLSFATAQAALMWILLAERPRTYEEFKKLCRMHGLTMADVRFQEAWAMAVWLAKAGIYELDESIEEATEEAVEDATR
jgi:HNH endonuclease